MSTPNEVLIAGERHFIILGQFGNLKDKINQLEHMIKASEATELLPFLEELENELAFLVNYYPRRDGSITSSGNRLPETADSKDSPEADQSKKDDCIRLSLLDMRSIADAATATYTHTGEIDCHLKTMFDAAWYKAAAVAGFDGVDGIPF